MKLRPVAAATACTALAISALTRLMVNPPPGRPKAGPAPSGGSAAVAAASVGAFVPPPGVKMRTR
ncbi:hypothetical protein GALL_505230 [mine drainage metagenome]|uniref:Uncharacterized protein n=1 Tax=mine drainage metagenome TaxID=410659 RepID=A0A1J5PAZ5_9ZZZZ